MPAILATLFCCLPTGIASIVFATQVSSKMSIGDFVGAKRSSDQARLWLFISVGLGVAWVALVVVIAVLAAVNGDYSDTSTY